MPTTPVRRGPNRPQDDAARERLRAAQRRETAAVASVYAAERALARAETKREETIAAVDRDLDRVRRELGSAQHELITVSGLTRAAQLLGSTAATLRRSASERTETPDQ